MSEFRNPMVRARQLGAAHSGTAHWFAQRLTAIALIPLGLAAAVLFFWGMHAGYHQVATWLHQPWVLMFVVLLVVVTFWHGTLGIQMIIEDYVPHKGLAFTMLTLLRFTSIAVGLLAVIAAAMVGFRSF